MEKIITKIAPAHFKIRIKDRSNFRLVLNFNPIIERFNLKGNYQLIHWQAKPFGYREWGVYNSLDDSYTSINQFQIAGNFKSLQIPDSEAQSIPSAVILKQ